MTIKRLEFGEYENQTVYLYTIENKNHTRISMLSYAATWQNFEVLQDNSYHSVLEHFDNLQDYIDTPYQVGKTVGRVAGRITGARFSIAKKEYQLRPNEGSNLLHSGKHGIQDYNFDAECFEDENKISFTQKISETKDGFPGDLDLKITYRLDDDDQVSITYTATSDKNTLFNPTCHAYFNVSNNDTIFDQKLQINSDKMLQIDDEKLPTGKILTADEAYDFKNPKTISTALKELKKNNGKLEFDDTYITESDLVATISSKNAAIDFYSDRNGLVIFTANPIDQVLAQARQYSSIAMELQTLPDAINHEGFGKTILPADKKISYTNRYHYRQLN